MNRDESRARPIARAPAIHLSGVRPSIYPTEPSPGNGTWIGVNDARLCLALINWYAIPTKPQSEPLSRGTIIPSLLATATLDEISERLEALPLHRFPPFRLLAFSLSEKQVREVRWNQSQLQSIPHSWAAQHWFSSGFDERTAQQQRGAVCRSAWKQPPRSLAETATWLRKLHASHEPHSDTSNVPAGGPFSICMHRPDAATVSYTEVAVDANGTRMNYHDGPLCEVPTPTATHCLPAGL